MIRRLFIIWLLGVAIAGADPAKVIDLIGQGRLEQAREEVARLSTASRRDGDLLYAQALLETDGAMSHKFLEAAVSAAVDPVRLEAIAILKARWYQAAGDYERLIETGDDYLRRWENGHYRSDILRLQALAYHASRRFVSSAKALDFLEAENRGEFYDLAGRLDRARSLYARKDYIAAQNICRNLANGKYDRIVAPALFMLSYYSIDQKRIDDAILYYNLLKEEYPDAVGLDDLVDRFTGLSDDNRADSRAEEITGTVYSVQVGVFSVRDNAAKVAADMKKFGEKVDIENKKISDKKYYIVYIGRFQTTAEAADLKNRLEAAQKEAYQVVAR